MNDRSIPPFALRTLPSRRASGPSETHRRNSTIIPQRVVVLDIETAPDMAAAGVLLGACGEEPLRRALGRRYAKPDQSPMDAFVKWPLHQIVTISFLDASFQDECWTIDTLWADSINNRSEAELLRELNSLLTDHPTLVGFNITGFDLPVIRSRALALGVIMHKVLGGPYWHRYDSKVIDLCDRLSSFGATSKPSLAEACAVFGLDAKAGGDGALVEAYAIAGDWDALNSYCATDVLATYHLYLRWLRAHGELNAAGYRASVSNAAETALARGLAEFRPNDVG